MTRSAEGGDHRASTAPSSSIQEELGYLFLFSDALLELVPDGIAVLDDRLRVRAANSAFARALGHADGDAVAGADLSTVALLQASVPQRDGASLRGLLSGIFDTGLELALDRLLAPGPEGVLRHWDVRATAWDTEDPHFRRILLWLRSSVEGAPQPAARESLRSESLQEEKDDRLSQLTARAGRLLDGLPIGVCVLDSALRVLAANRKLLDTLDRAFRPDQPGDRHLFAIFPELRDDEFRQRLERCRDSMKPVRGTLTATLADGSPIDVDVEVQPVDGPDGGTGELLLLFHEVRGMPAASPPPRPEADFPTPGHPEEILTPENVRRWQPRNRRILVVEQDAWARMILSDALRDAGHEDLALAESAADVLDRHDPGAFGLVIVGFDADADAAAGLCRRVVADTPHVPVLAVAQRPGADVAGLLSGLSLFGTLTAPSPEELGAVLAGLFRLTGPEPLPAEPASEAGPPEGGPRPLEVVLLGAADADVAVLRLMYRVQRMKIRMVYDPDPSAFGLSLAQNLGIPAISGDLSMSLETPPDAVVLAREGLEDRLAPLELQDVPRVTRDEIELFLVDPESFLAAGRRAGVPPSSAAAEQRESPDPKGEIETPHHSWDPPSLGAQAVERPPERPPEPACVDEEEVAVLDQLESAVRAAEPAADREDGSGTAAPEIPSPAPEAAPATEPSHGSRILGGDATARTSSGQVSDDVDSVLGALDLLLDFDRFAARVLHIALDLVSGVSGSLMILGDQGQELRIAASRGLSDLVVQKTRQQLGEGVAGRVARGSEPLLLVGTIRDQVDSEWDRPDIRSSVCVPVVSDERVIGVLNVNSDPDRGSFDRDTLRDLTALGQKIGPALDRSLVLRRMRERSFELSVRGEIERIAASASDPVSCLRRIADRLVEMLAVDTCGIYLLDPKSNELTLRAVAGAKAAMDAISVPVGTGVVGWVARELRPMALRSWGSDTGTDEVNAATIALPIRYRTDLVGVLHIESAATGRIDEDRLEILGTMASVIGQQVGEFQAHESSERKVTMLSALSELGLAFSAVPEREGLARLVTFSASTLLGSDVSTMRVLAEGHAPSSTAAEDYEMLAAHGASFGGPGDPLAELETCLAQEVADTRSPCRDTDVAAATIAPLLERSNVAAALAIPLTSGDGELVSILTVYRVVDAHVTSPAFRDEDVEIATRLADYAAASVQRLVGATEETGEEEMDL